MFDSVGFDTQSGLKSRKLISSSFDLSYELDIWGRVRRSIEAARADARAVAANLEVVLLTLTADVARNYQFLRALDNEP